MKLWPVVTGVAIALTLVACKSPTPPKGVQPISGFDASRFPALFDLVGLGLTPAVTLENGMKSPAWRIASSEAWSR